MARRPTILVFDSGLGGLTVFAEIVKTRAEADIVYLADDAGFPYGGLAPEDLVERVAGVLDRQIVATAPDLVVIACNTASTLVLPDLRTRFPSLPFVGTVPAIKPAAALSRTKRISVLATPGTVARDYTRGLIESFAADCRVTLVGSSRLASLAEASMAGECVSDAAVSAEILPCFVEEDGARTDCVVLACTHYPLLRRQFERLAPWPVTYIDPAQAIARRVDAVLAERGFLAPMDRRPARRTAIFTSGRAPAARLASALSAFGLQTTDTLTAIS